jgi:glycosyltransferase involved in cell wall biosynthesis/O-antigen/teichoic acid export membrane protein
MKILLLTDRDWTHPQGGGTGTNLRAQVLRWLDWGHEVTVIAGAYPGARRVESPAPGLTIHRMGGRVTVFPRAAWATLRGVGRDADVVLEVVNGIAFGSPAWWWLDAPTVALIHHVHQDHYVAEMGRTGRVAAFAAEKAPLRLLYRDVPILTISQAARDDLIALGLPADHLHVAHLGVDVPPHPFGERAPEPRLLYLGRLKQYKRIELVLDVLEAIPGAQLDIAGDGDHRPALEREIRARGLADRVTLHGHVSEERKAELYGRAWVHLTASSAEGWCLTVMEAALAGTPSAALRVGGLAESIVHGETGLLADTPEELVEAVRSLVADPARREALGAAAAARARGFTWERTARQNLAVLEQAAARRRRSVLADLRRSETAKAAGMALATLSANAIAIVFTVIFTRLLGVADYGALGALLSTFTIFAVAGSALQVAVARETALGHLGRPDAVGATTRRWLAQLGVLGAALTAASIAAREPLAGLLAVPEHPWAAAAVVPTGVAWMALGVLRGALQGIGAYAPVAHSVVLEALGRLVLGLVLVAVGAGVTGAYLGTPLSMIAATLVLAAVLARRAAAPGRRAAGGPAEARTRTLPSLVSGGWAPIIGLVLLAALQNVDVIVAKREMDDDAAGAYAAAVVAAKLVVWVAIGIGLYLLPEATRRAAAGRDPRPVFLRALALIGVVAAPALLVFALVPSLLLRVAFGAEYTTARDALVVLGAAMALLAVAYLAVQYMLALRRSGFLWLLALVAVAEPVLLTAGDFGLVSFAAIVLATQCAAAAGALALALRSAARVPTGAVAT